MSRVSLNRYLHQPVQILWFDSNEIMIIVFSYLLWLMGGGITIVSFVFVPFIIKFKRRQNRGYFNQLIYFLGFMEMKGYPDASEVRFYE